MSACHFSKPQVAYRSVGIFRALIQVPPLNFQFSASTLEIVNYLIYVHSLTESTVHISWSNIREYKMWGQIVGDTLHTFVPARGLWLTVISPVVRSTYQCESVPMLFH